MKQGVFIGIPSLSGLIRRELAGWLAALVELRHQPDCPWWFEWKILEGCAPVEYARNRVVAAFLESDCERLWMVDDDMKPPEDWSAMLNVASDIVGGRFMGFWEGGEGVHAFRMLAIRRDGEHFKSVLPQDKFLPGPQYSRSNITYELRTGTWRDLTGNFITSLAPQYLSTKDVLSYGFSYLNVQNGDNIYPLFFQNTTGYDVYDLQAFIDAHPDKKFFLWTTSLARGIGTGVSESFNNSMRDYARTNNIPLFDLADIESHTDLGTPCYDNRDGIVFRTENYPDDGLNIPAICQDWTTETDGGLGSVSGSGIRTSKAFWVLLARLSGWNP